MDAQSQSDTRQLRISDLSVDYGDVPALREINLDIAFGRSLAIIGPNGAGKSTLIKAVAGLIPVGYGNMKWNGGGTKNGDIAYLAQQSEVDWSFPLTVRDLVELGRYPHTSWWRKFGKTDHVKVEEALVSMDLVDLADRQIGALSGGQRQRAFLARALAQEAQVLLLDEPFGGLDLPSHDMLIDLLAGLSGGGRLIMISHHELETVADICDDVLLLKRSVVAFGPVAETLTQSNLELCFGENIHADKYGLTSSSRSGGV